jgi:hypothetical protein
LEDYSAIRHLNAPSVPDATLGPSIRHEEPARPQPSTSSKDKDKDKSARPQPNTGSKDKDKDKFARPQPSTSSKDKDKDKSARPQLNTGSKDKDKDKFARPQPSTTTADKSARPKPVTSTNATATDKDTRAKPSTSSKDKGKGGKDGEEKRPDGDEDEYNEYGGGDNNYGDDDGGGGKEGDRDDGDRKDGGGAGDDGGGDDPDDSDGGAGGPAAQRRNGHLPPCTETNLRKQLKKRDRDAARYVAIQFFELAKNGLYDTQTCLGLIRRTLNYRMESNRAWVKHFMDRLVENPARLEDLTGNPFASSTLVDVILREFTVGMARDDPSLLVYLAKPIGIWLLYSSTRAMLRSVNPRSLRARVDQLREIAAWLFTSQHKQFVDTLLKDAQEIIKKQPETYRLHLYIRELVKALQSAVGSNYTVCPENSEYMAQRTKCEPPGDMELTPVEKLGFRKEPYWNQFRAANA